MLGRKKNPEPAPLGCSCYLTFLPFLFFKKWGGGRRCSSGYFLLNRGVVEKGYWRTVGAEQQQEAKEDGAEGEHFLGCEV